jgi:hypothetical protein
MRASLKWKNCIYKRKKHFNSMYLLIIFILYPSGFLRRKLINVKFLIRAGQISQTRPLERFPKLGSVPWKPCPSDSYACLAWLISPRFIDGGRGRNSETVAQHRTTRDDRERTKKKMLFIFFKQCELPPFVYKLIRALL